MNTVKAVFRALVFLALTLPLMPVQRLLLWLHPRKARELPHRYHRWLTQLFGISVTVKGQPPKQGPCLLVSNHVSWLDIVILSAVAPVSFVAKQEVARWPLFGTLARLQRTVFVDRNSRQRAGAHADDIAARLRTGDIIVLFPEGTSHDGNSVLPFKSSLFSSSSAPDITIIPVSLAYARRWGLPMLRRERPHYAWYGDMALLPHLWNFLGEGPLGVTVVFHAPLSTEEGLDRKAAARSCERAVREGLLAALHAQADLR